MLEVIHRFVDSVKRREIDIYNEFSLQHELGIMLRAQLLELKIQFERNVTFFFRTGEFIKKEIDISVFSPDRSELKYAVELKFPRNGQYPEQMFSFCKDILFIEQLKSAGFERSFLVVFADDPLFYSGSGGGIYGYFRKGQKLYGAISKPTGKKDEIISLKGSYHVRWAAAGNDLKYTVIEANTGQQAVALDRP
ncbi:MAG: hypothetical protein AB1634_17995 [Thermodesulfobacteriota bacterium]